MAMFLEVDRGGAIVLGLALLLGAALIGLPEQTAAVADGVASGVMGVLP
jgi:hypothetical protein